MPNRLKDETSPYLLQHADNPVDWFPWGDEAFEAANMPSEAREERVRDALDRLKITKQQLLLLRACYRSVA